MALTCSNCQTQLPGDAAFCYKCGKPVAEPIEQEKVASNKQSALRQPDESIKQELEEEAKPYKGGFIDFDEERYFLQKRARKWAEYSVQQFTDLDWQYLLAHLLTSDKNVQQKWLEDYAVTIRNSLFSEERRLIWTNTPHAHEALFIEEVINQYIDKARERGYLGDVGGTKFTEKAIRFLRLTLEYYSEKLPSVHFPDFGSIRTIANKDKELFPDPEPIRVEVAGAIISYTSWEAALVVYMDCAFTGKSLHISVKDDYVRFIDSKLANAKIIERTDGTKSICAAIFPRIPLVTDHHRRHSKVVTCVDCAVSYWTATDRAEPTYTETVTLFRGQVIDIDWRGRKI